MSTIIKDGAFEAGTEHEFTRIEEVVDLASTSGNLDLSSDTNPAKIAPYANQFKTIRIDFPSSHDGRGFSIARALRNAGYNGHLRAYGHVLADQYPLAIRSGFNDVEISDELAERQPESQWLDAWTRINSNYQDRLKQPATPASVAA